MNQLLRSYTDLLGNLFSCLFLLRFTEVETREKISWKNKLFLLIPYAIYSIPEHVPYSTLVCCLIEFLFFLKLLYPHIKKILVIFAKYNFFMYLFTVLILFVHTYVMQDTKLLNTSSAYSEYKSLTVLFLLYVFYVLYTNTKKMRDFHTHYQISFNLVIACISLMLSYTTLYICRENSSSYALPAIFSTIALLIIICISLYDRFLALVAENTRQKIQSEIQRMEQAYSDQIDANLKELHSIRHDMKNHLIIIDGYAAQQNYEKIHAYINKITGSFHSEPLFDTPSNTVSALLNEKYQTAKRQNISCRIHTDFPYIHIDDFSIITILGNLFDNAITAACKCENGWIHMDLSQSDSYLALEMQNSHIETIKESNGEFITTKEDKNILHGIGIKNVRKAVEALNGQLSITYTKDTFTVHILVPNY